MTFTRSVTLTTVYPVDNIVLTATYTLSMQRPLVNSVAKSGLANLLCIINDLITGSNLRLQVESMNAGICFDLGAASPYTAATFRPSAKLLISQFK